VNGRLVCAIIVVRYTMEEIVIELSHGEKLCDSIFRLYQPQGLVQLEVVLVHGLEHPNYYCELTRPFWCNDIRRGLVKDKGIRQWRSQRMS